MPTKPSLKNTEFPGIKLSGSEFSGSKLTGSELTEADISRIIEMAWEDRTPFEAIEHQYGLNEQ